MIQNYLFQFSPSSPKAFRESIRSRQSWQRIVSDAWDTLFSCSTSSSGCVELISLTNSPSSLTFVLCVRVLGFEHQIPGMLYKNIYILLWRFNIPDIDFQYSELEFNWRITLLHFFPDKYRQIFVFAALKNRDECEV